MNILARRNNNNMLVDDLVRQCNLQPKIESALRALDRALYIEPDEDDEYTNAYGDSPWRRGNLHLSAPSIYSRVITELKLEPGLSFLNLGSGTGYLNTLVGLLLGPNGLNHGIEIHEDVIKYAKVRLQNFKATNHAIDKFDFCEPHFFQGNCLNLNPDLRYDRVYLGAACLPDRVEFMKKLLNPNGGILVMPESERLMKYTRLSENIWETHVFMNVNFTPMIGHENYDPFGTEAKMIDLPRKQVKTLKEWCRIRIRQNLRLKTDRADPNLLYSDNLSKRLQSRSHFYKNESRRSRYNWNLLIKSSRQIAREMRRNRSGIVNPGGRNQASIELPDPRRHLPLPNNRGTSGRASGGGSNASGCLGTAARSLRQRSEPICQCPFILQSFSARVPNAFTVRNSEYSWDQPSGSSSGSGTSVTIAQQPAMSTNQPESRYLTRRASRLMDSEGSGANTQSTTSTASSMNEPHHRRGTSADTSSSPVSGSHLPVSAQPSSSSTISPSVQIRCQETSSSNRQSSSSSSRHLVFPREERGDDNLAGGLVGLSQNLRAGARRSLATPGSSSSSAGPPIAHHDLRSIIYGTRRRVNILRSSLSSSSESSSDSSNLRRSIEARLVNACRLMNQRRREGYVEPDADDDEESSSSEPVQYFSDNSESSLSSEEEDSFDFYDEDVDKLDREAANDEDGLENSDEESESGEEGNDNDDRTGGTEVGDPLASSSDDEPKPRVGSGSSLPQIQLNTEPVASRLRSRQVPTSDKSGQEVEPEASSSHRAKTSLNCPVHGKQRKSSHKCRHKHHHRHGRCYNRHHSRHRLQPLSQPSASSTSTNATQTTSATQTEGLSSSSLPSAGGEPQAQPSSDQQSSTLDGATATTSNQVVTTRSSSRLQTGTGAVPTGSTLALCQRASRATTSRPRELRVAIDSSQIGCGHPIGLDVRGKRKRQVISSSSSSASSSCSEYSLSSPARLSPSHRHRRRRQSSSRLCRARCTCPKSVTSQSGSQLAIESFAPTGGHSSSVQDGARASQPSQNASSERTTSSIRSRSITRTPSRVAILEATIAAAINRRDGGSQTREFGSFFERCIDFGVRHALYRRQLDSRRRILTSDEDDEGGNEYISRYFVQRPRIPNSSSSHIDVSNYAASQGLSAAERTRRNRMLRDITANNRHLRNRHSNECLTYYLHLSCYISQLPVPQVLLEYLNFYR